ncbi:antiterminator LoaP [Alkalispirochaeta americana]|uniref:antiterminator LoaP n=1 Tax=Alkalispirochaeta americana TaxID=159291 RepID=UPI0013564FD9|nr:antiterminator LoaP [Alkalispirochaeta americana]
MTSELYYAIQVLTGEEQLFMQRVEKQIHRISGAPGIPACRLRWPRRTLTIRRKGKRVTTIQPIFPGYLFLETPEVTPELYHLLRRSSGFIRFLPENHALIPLEAKELRLVQHLLSFGDVLKESTVTFDTNNRIVVKAGPLQGLEGRIVKVDKRKGRAKVQLDLYDTAFLIDLGFRALEKAPDPPCEPAKSSVREPS